MLQEENKSINPRKKNSNSSNIDLKCHFKHLQACLNASIKVAKEKYHNIVNKLINTQKNSEVYWSLLKVFLNNKKIPIIPPLSYENRFITDFKQKAKLFNFFFLLFLFLF